MKLLVLLIASMLLSCAKTEVYNCTVGADVEQALQVAVNQWSELEDIVDRMDVFCVSHEQLLSVSRCGISTVRKDENFTSCAMWPGTSPAYRGRIYIQNDVDAAKSAAHEISHFRSVVWRSKKGCQTHLQTCGWDKDGLKAVMARIDEARGYVLVP